MTIANDKRLMALDFISEAGNMLSVAGAAISAAASAGRLDVLEMAFRQAKNAIAEGLDELNTLSAEEDGGAYE